MPPNAPPDTSVLAGTASLLQSSLHPERGKALVASTSQDMVFRGGRRSLRRPAYIPQHVLCSHKCGSSYPSNSNLMARPFLTGRGCISTLPLAGLRRTSFSSPVFLKGPEPSSVRQDTGQNGGSSRHSHFKESRSLRTVPRTEHSPISSALYIAIRKRRNTQLTRTPLRRGFSVALQKQKTHSTFFQTASPYRQRHTLCEAGNLSLYIQQPLHRNRRRRESPLTNRHKFEFNRAPRL